LNSKFVQYLIENSKGKIMKVKVETRTIQVIDGKEETIIQNGVGEINKFEKGSILLWQVPKENLHFKMTILDDKVLLKKQDQDMVFELNRTTKSVLQTQYGELDMNITTTGIEVVCENEQIKEIRLWYNIEIENLTKYENKIEIKIR
jgi:uncharacterized beta-barrel protein YwiB (DUF1934 family)